MTDTKRWKRVAGIIAQQRLALTPIEALSPRSQPRDETQGYALQTEVSRLLSKSGLGRVVACLRKRYDTVLRAFRAQVS